MNITQFIKDRDLQHKNQYAVTVLKQYIEELAKYKVVCVGDFVFKINKLDVGQDTLDLMKDYFSLLGYKLTEDDTYLLLVTL